jgi:uncharacterized protein
VFIDVNLLERRKLRFDDAFPPGSLQFPDSWRQTGDLRASGNAELLDRGGSQTIRVWGHIRVQGEGLCARCLESIPTSFDADFELFYYPMGLIAREESVPINYDDTDVGFYEGNGLELEDVLKEQVLLWLPMRWICRDDCLGICPQCGENRNLGHCQCQTAFEDSRWDALRKLHLKGRN